MSENSEMRAVLLAKKDILDSVNIPNDITESGRPSSLPPREPPSFESTTKQLERELIMKALEESGGNKSRAAKILNMNERTFYRRLKNLGIL
jgi:DNA-binding NtrC family response regulator